MHAPLRALLCALPLLAYAASSPTPAFAYDDAGYLEYADRMTERLDRTWNDERGIYVPGSGGVDALVNAGLLLTHSVAAQEGHRGPARNDQRARRIARALVSAPVFIDHRPTLVPPGSQFHVPGWGSSMDSSAVGQHLVFDAGIVDGLVHAWKARRAIDLPDETAQMIVDRIHRVASSGFYRWPTIRLNQVNWYALIYAADATVTGRSGLLRRDLRAQLVALRVRVAQLRPRPALPVHPACAAVDPLERRLRRVREHRHLVPALLQPGAPRGHGAAATRRSRADPALDPPRDRGLLDARRLHELGQRARVRALAPGEEARPRPGGADRDRADAATPARPRVGALGEVDARPRAALLRAAARARGRTAGPGAVPALHEPADARAARGSPPRASRPTPRARSRRGSDGCAASGRRRCTPSTPTSGGSRSRRAPTTPRSSRPTSARSRTAASSSRGCSTATRRSRRGSAGVRPRRSGCWCASRAASACSPPRPGRSRVDPNVTPLRLTRAPSGTGASVRTRPGKVFAGPFRDLRARGTYTAGRFRAVTSHRFTPTSIETRWALTRLRGVARLQALALLPSWGSAARVVAVLRDGSRVSLRSRSVALARVRHFEVISRRSGYTVVPLRRPARAVARVMVPSRQSSAPDPGPTLAVELAHGASWRRVSFAVRIMVTRR